MPITVAEKFLSRPSTRGDNPQTELAYIISGTDDDLAARSALASAAPLTYDGLSRQTIQLDPLGDGLWEGSAHYGSTASQQLQPGESSFAFDTGGGTQHITQSISTVASYAASGTPPDFQGAIGVTQDNVEGVDITVPIYQFSETHYLSHSVVTPTYRGTLFALTGKVNNASFKGLSAGECLFLGASGSRRGTGSDDDWEITFRFAASPNATGLTIGDITSINKGGWDYMWVRYQDAEDDTAKALIKKPVAVYVEKVYERANFADLGIGT